MSIDLHMLGEEMSDVMSEVMIVTNIMFNDRILRLGHMDLTRRRRHCYSAQAETPDYRRECFSNPALSQTSKLIDIIDGRYVVCHSSGQSTQPNNLKSSSFSSSPPPFFSARSSSSSSASPTLRPSKPANSSSRCLWPHLPLSSAAMKLTNFSCT